MSFQDSPEVTLIEAPETSPIEAESLFEALKRNMTPRNVRLGCLLIADAMMISGGLLATHLTLGGQLPFPTDESTRLALQIWAYGESAAGGALAIFWGLNKPKDNEESNSDDIQP